MSQYTQFCHIIPDIYTAFSKIHPISKPAYQLVLDFPICHNLSTIHRQKTIPFWKCNRCACTRCTDLRVTTTHPESIPTGPLLIMPYLKCLFFQHVCTLCLPSSSSFLLLLLLLLLPLLLFLLLLLPHLLLLFFFSSSSFFFLFFSPPPRSSSSFSSPPPPPPTPSSPSSSPSSSYMALQSNSDLPILNVLLSVSLFVTEQQSVASGSTSPIFLPFTSIPPHTAPETLKPTGDYFQIYEL